MIFATTNLGQGTFKWNDSRKYRGCTYKGPFSENSKHGTGKLTDKHGEERLVKFYKDKEIE